MAAITYTAASLLVSPPTLGALIGAEGFYFVCGKTSGKLKYNIDAGTQP
jgi:hypothetical protein